MSGAVKRARFPFDIAMFSIQISTCNLRVFVLIYLYTVPVLEIPKPESLSLSVS